MPKQAYFWSYFEDYFEINFVVTEILLILQSHRFLKKGLKSRLTLSQNKLKILLPFSHKGSQNLWPTLTLSSFLLYIELQITKLIECSKELPTSR